MYMTHGALYQSLCGDAAVFRPQLLFQRAAVNADPDGDAPFPTGLRHCPHILPAPDVAWINAQSINSPLRTCKGQLVVKVDIRNQGDGNPRLDGVHCRCRRHIGNSHPDNLTAGVLQGMNLRYRGVHVVSLGIAHGLDGYRSSAAYGHAAHCQFFRHFYSSLNREFMQDSKISLHL